jgi:SAM-dependent methyltransferase
MPPESQILKSTERFTDRVDDYAKSRPHYPQAVFDMLRAKLGFGPGTIVADIGSGTGISAGPLLDLGCQVYAIEPNDAMRLAAEQWLGSHPGFHSVLGTAEQTTLGERSVDAIVSAQAFHWFDVDKARREFARILKERGWVVLIWNERTHGGDFDDAYELLNREFAIEYKRIRESRGKAATSGVNRLFDRSYEAATFENDQFLDFQRLKGLLLSASYTPRDGDPRRIQMVSKLRETFDRFQSEGVVRMRYITNVYWGQLTSRTQSV